MRQPSRTPLSGADDGTLFLATSGAAINPLRLAEIVRFHIDAAGIGKRGACHLFRNTMATLMLENGVDIRFIPAMLGHAELSTTEIYTQVSIKALKAIHSATHPAKAPEEGRVPDQAGDAASVLLEWLDREGAEEG